MGNVGRKFQSIRFKDHLLDAETENYHSMPATKAKVVAIKDKKQKRQWDTVQQFELFSNMSGINIFNSERLSLSELKMQRSSPFCEKLYK